MSWMILNMRLFGKKKLTEKDLSDGLVFKVSRDVYDNWNDIETKLREIFRQPTEKEDATELSEVYAPLLIVCIIFTDMQALKNLLPKDQFLRIRSYVLEKLSDTLQSNEVAGKLLEVYQSSWDNALKRNENPVTFGVASEFYDQAEFPCATGFNGEKIQNHQALLYISEIILSIVGFCKFAVSEYKVIL